MEIIILNEILKTAKSFIDVGFEVLTAVVINSAILWDITSFSHLNVNRRFRGTYRLHHQGRQISWAINQRESRCVSQDHIASIFRVEKISWARNQRESSLPPAFTLVSCSAYFFDVSPKRRLTFNGLHDVINHEYGTVHPSYKLLSEL
jgi:hypothetical protein